MTILSNSTHSLLICTILLIAIQLSISFTTTSTSKVFIGRNPTTNSIQPSFFTLHKKSSSTIQSKFSSTSTTQIFFFNKIFEEQGPLGKGITVGKVQVALNTNDRSIIHDIEQKVKQVERSSSDTKLATLTNQICLLLLRRNSDWISACSESEWFSENDGGKAESLFNAWSNREASKFEKEYYPGSDSSTDSSNSSSGPTIVVVSLVVEIQGDNTNFKGAGYSLSGTKEVLSSIASDSMVDEGYCINAAEIFWTPGDKDEVLRKNDVILDFPELIDL